MPETRAVLPTFKHTRDTMLEEDKVQSIDVIESTLHLGEKIIKINQLSIPDVSHNDTWMLDLLSRYVFFFKILADTVLGLFFR